MDERTYADIAQQAGQNLLRALPGSYKIGRDCLPADVTTAVYVIESRGGRVLYVGSTRRLLNPSALISRMGEHLADNRKSVTWDRLTVLPLRSDTPADEVHRIEGAVSCDLNPAMGSRHPRDCLK